jgi:hypothetical protein
MPWANHIWSVSLRPIEEQGFVIVAVGDQYLDCAQRLAQSVRRWHTGARICLVTDQEGPTDYDHVRLLQDVDRHNVWANDWQVYNLTPFRETIKLEADMLIVSDIRHWWNQLRHTEVCVSTGCRTWQDQLGTSRHYRRAFDHNHLPDVYNAITYWRRSELARDFFLQVRDIFQNWEQYRRLILSAEDVPSTDLVYAMAAQILGPERVTQPWAAYPRIVHMKQHMIGAASSDWTQELVWESVDDGLRINGLTQWGAVHYHAKTWQP